MKKLLLIIAIVMSFSAFAQNTAFYALKTKTIDGKEFSFSSLKGKKVLIVNTASRCGHTPQYKDLQALYETYSSKGLVIIGFPANNFLSQEPGSNSEIKQFCTEKYNVTFPMMQKISVKGDDMDPIYKWLTQKSENGVMDAPVTWNFQKFMIDENGKLIGMVPPKDNPKTQKILDWLDNK
ncbi:MAG: glutathione peroxidase [Bacteroidales bacterium]|nr:glutathione peroxidase [Bacteroidales bacterium]